MARGGDEVRQKCGDIYVVYYNKKYAMFQMERVNDIYSVDFYEWNTLEESIEIIGNQYEEEK